MGAVRLSCTPMLKSSALLEPRLVRTPSTLLGSTKMETPLTVWLIADSAPTSPSTVGFGALRYVVTALTREELRIDAMFDVEAAGWAPFAGAAATAVPDSTPSRLCPSPGS